MVDNFNKKYSTSIIHDETVDPIKDMYSWLSQVAAMDFVISIANTTVHGSGGLGVPTMCLVSTNSDWRWVDPKFMQVIIGTNLLMLHINLRMVGGMML